MENNILDTQDAAKMCGLAPQTLANYRSMGKGPSYLKIGGRIVYLLEDLIAWRDSHRVQIY